jgi:hypothetical protein
MMVDKAKVKQVLQFAITATKKVAKGSTYKEIDASLSVGEKYKGLPVYIVWIETPDKHAADMVSALNKHPDIHPFARGDDPGDYDWAGDYYNRDTSWVKFVISATKP